MTGKIYYITILHQRLPNKVYKMDVKMAFARIDKFSNLNNLT